MNKITKEQPHNNKDFILGKVANPKDTSVVCIDNLGEKSSGTGSNDVGTQISDEFNRLVRLGHSPARSAALIVLAAQREKLRQARSGVVLDGSVQSTIAWISESTKGTEKSALIARACYHSMGLISSLDESVSACAKECRQITRDIKSTGNHRRNVVLISVSPLDIRPDRGTGSEDVFSILLNNEGCRQHVFGPSAHLSITQPSPLLQKIISRFFLNQTLRDFAPWPGLNRLSDFLSCTAATIKENKNISELIVLHKHAEAGVASAVGESLSDLWSSPYFGPGSDSLVTKEMIYLAAKRACVRDKYDKSRTFA